MGKVTMTLGGGGKATNDFIKGTIIEKLGNCHLNKLRDSALLDIDKSIAFTTDSFVVTPEFFPGGDIGKLAVYGTCNDLAVSGAKPLYLSLSMIISEGYEFEKLERIIESIKDAANIVGVKVVCGDTKVIERGKHTNIFINTSGIGLVEKDLNNYQEICAGDKVIFSSDLARHGLSVMIERNDFHLESNILSDCCNLYEIFEKIGYNGIKFARDATRGGVAAVLNEISEMSGKGFNIIEEKICVQEQVKYLCDFLGFDYLNVANEGVAVLICDSESAEDILSEIKRLDICRNANIVGEVTENSRVLLLNEYGGSRIIEIPDGNLLPRIC